MSIEFIFNSVTIQYEDMLEQFPGLTSELGKFLSSPKKRRRKEKKERDIS